MDQLKKILSKAAKHQFWIVTGLAVVMGIAAFFMASSTIGKLFDDQKLALDEQYTNISNVRSAIPTHPNEFSSVQMQTIIDSLADDVQAAWLKQYERQVRFLQWSDAIKETNPSLVRKLESYSPVELKLEYPTEPANITKGEKQAYDRYFDLQMPALAKIIGVEWVGEASKTAAGMGGYGMGGYGGEGMGSDGGYGMGGEGGYGMGGEGGYGMGGEGGYGMGMGGMAAAISNKPRDLVTWPKTSQDELLSSIQLWTGDTPDVYQILYTQENMWILEGLLNIIKKTNGDALANFQCTIKEIEFIRIGKAAVGRAGDVSTAATSTGGMYAGSSGGGYGMEGMEGSYGDEGSGMMSGMGGEGMGEYGGESSGSGMGSEMGMGMGMAGPVVRDPANGRYVDASFAPVTGDDLRTKMKSGSAEDAYFAVAKRVPVRMRFKLDQRNLQDFLAICGSADLMLEIRQVRIGDTKAAAKGGSSAGGFGGYGGMSGEAPGGMGGMGLGGMGGEGMGGEGMGGEGYGGEGMGMGGYGDSYGSGMGSGMGMGMGLKKDPYDIPVEVYGIVYLFNPVDINALGLAEVTGETEITDTVENPAVIDEPATDVPPGNIPPTNEAPVEGADPNPATQADPNEAGEAKPQGEAGAATDPSVTAPK